MNLLEHYIKEIKSVEPCNEDWVKEFPDRKLLTIKVIVECYGVVEERKTVESESGWENIKKLGYFMW